MTGSAAETNMVGFDFTSVWSTVSASDADSSEDSYPILASVDSVIVSESSSEEYGGMSILAAATLLIIIGGFWLFKLLSSLLGIDGGTNGLGRIGRLLRGGDD
jgi:hypothetical protein